MDPLSLNFDQEATKENFDCDYSSVVFYASGNSVGDKKVIELVIRVGITSENTADYIGAITTFNQAIPTGCGAGETVTYNIESGTSYTWHADYMLESDGFFSAQGYFSPNNSEACIPIDVLSNQ